MSVRLAEALRTVLEVTPVPPSADTDPSEILVLGQTMTLARAEPLAALAALVESNPALAEAGGELLATLRERDARWSALILRAHQELKQRVAALGHSRRR